MLLIDATNIGGGAGVLLQYLAQSLLRREVPHFILCSHRVKLEGNPQRFGKSIAPFSIRRQWLLRHYCQKLSPSHLFCYGNVPPLQGLQVKRTSTYFHNALLIGNLEPPNLNLSFRARLWILRQSIAFFARNTDKWLFQTQFVSQSFGDYYSVPSSSRMLFPFFECCEKVESSDSRYDFVYCSNLAPHKNHINLLRAIEICATRGFKPSVVLTISVPEEHDLYPILKRCRELGASIHLAGEVDRAEALAITSQSRFVVFPSKLETIGLGLIEAASLGKKVICSDLPWVRDVIEPSLSFDANSPESIADCMQDAFHSKSPRPTKMVIKDQIDELIDWLSLT